MHARTPLATYCHVRTGLDIRWHLNSLFITLSVKYGLLKGVGLTVNRLRVSNPGHVVARRRLGKFVHTHVPLLWLNSITATLVCDLVYDVLSAQNVVPEQDADQVA